MCRNEQSQENEETENMFQMKEQDKFQQTDLNEMEVNDLTR